MRPRGTGRRQDASSLSAWRIDHPVRDDLALAWGRESAEEWIDPLSTEVIECIGSNRVLSDLTLAVTKRSPFDFLAERASFGLGRGDWI